MRPALPSDDVFFCLPLRRALHASELPRRFNVPASDKITCGMAGSAGIFYDEGEIFSMNAHYYGTGGGVVPQHEPPGTNVASA